MEIIQRNMLGKKITSEEVLDQWENLGKVQTWISHTGSLHFFNISNTHANSHTHISEQSPTATGYIPFHPDIKRDHGAVAVGSHRDPRTGTSAVRPVITGGTCVEQMSPASPTAGRAGEQKRRPLTCHLQISTQTASPHNTTVKQMQNASY